VNRLALQVGNLATGIIHNVATHPLNRTRFYKLELQGTAMAALGFEEQLEDLVPRSAQHSVNIQ
jgi:hypothetical protein